MSGLVELERVELEHRASRLAGVSFPKRTIELVVMPYETETDVEYHGRAITEIVSRGAFDGIERRSNRVTVNRDHDVGRACGRALSFHPSREEGLVAEVRISRTELGEETLVLADDGILDASAGFNLMWEKTPTGRRARPGAETWESRSYRRLNHLWLDHIAFTPNPAYVDAKVLAVRNASTTSQEAAGRIATPNLDLVKGWRLEEDYGRLESI